MRPISRYAAVSVLSVGIVVAGVWFGLGPPSRFGVLVAACIAVPLQVAGFALLRSKRDDSHALMAVWVGGALARLAAVVVMAVVVLRVERLEPAATLIALAGFLFGLSLLEQRYVETESRDTV